MEVFIIGAALGVIPAAIAKSKGHGFVLWWIFGSFLFIVALPVALLMRPDVEAIEQDKLRNGMKKCPFCAELIKAEAKVCKHCGRELSSPPPAKQVPCEPPQTKVPQRSKPTRFRIVGREMATQRRIIIPNWEAPDIETAKQRAKEIGVIVSTIEPMDTPACREPEIAPNRETVATAPTVPQAESPLRLVAPTVALVIVGLVTWWGIASWQAAKAVQDRATENFNRAASVLGSSASSNLTLVNFGKIRTGMSRYDVEDILGSEAKMLAKNEFGSGTVYHIVTVSLEWRDGPRAVTCMFQNGKLVQKAQRGL